MESLAAENHALAEHSQRADRWQTTGTERAQAKATVDVGGSNQCVATAAASTVTATDVGDAVGASSESPQSQSAHAAGAATAPFSRPLRVVTHIAGLRHNLKPLAARAVAAGLAADAWLPRPGLTLTAQREPSNPRDPHAIRLLIDCAGSSCSASAEADTPVDATAAGSDVPSSALLPLGHVPASLARFLSPLLLRQLVRVEVRVVAADGADGEPRDDSPDAESSPSDSVATALSTPISSAAADAAATTPAIPAARTPLPIGAASKQADRAPIQIDIFPATEEHSFDTTAQNLWQELEAQVAAMTADANVSTDERVVANFALVVEGVMDVFPQLYTSEEIASVRSLLSLPFPAQRLFVRLFGRTRPQRWFQISALKYDAQEVQTAIDVLAVVGCASRPTNASTSAPPLVESDPLSMPSHVRALTAPVVPATEAGAMNAPVEEKSASEVLASPISSAFMRRASTLSIEEWADALPSLLHSCTLPVIRDLIAALGVGKLLGRAGSANPKQQLIHHLTTQRSLFARSMLHCTKTRRAVLEICGDFLQLSPKLLLLCQRMHRLFFLQNDPSEPSPMLLEHVGVSRFHNSKVALFQQQQQQQPIAATIPQSPAAHSDAELTGADAPVATASAAAASSSFADAPGGEAAPTRWTLFPTRSCYLAYDLAVQFLLQMHEVCECVLQTGEARRADQAYSAAQALDLLREASRRLDLELERPDSTQALDGVALSPNIVSPQSGKARDAATFASLFPRSHSSPSAASPASSPSPKTAAPMPGCASGASFSPTAPIASIDTSHFHPCDPTSAEADTYFDSTLRGSHAFARPYRAAWVYACACHYGARVLEREKRYAEANALYMRLLSTPLAAHRRGQWWNRLALNFETHLKDRPRAYRMCVLALRDTSVRCGDLHELRVRSIRLWKHKDGGGGRRPCPVAHADSMPDFGRVRAVRDISTGAGGVVLAHAPHTPSTGCSPQKQVVAEDLGYASVQTPQGVRLTTVMAAPLGFLDGEHSRYYDGENRACRVEDLLLTQYAREEFGSYVGLKDEGVAFRALFALLMYPALFAPVPHVFHTRFCDAPLDLGCDLFYQNRREIIRETLEGIRKCPSLSDLLAEAWGAHHGVRVRGINWRSASLGLAVLQQVAECMGGDAIAFVCETLARDYAGWGGGGLPDLLLWRPGRKPAPRVSAAPIAPAPAPAPPLSAPLQRLGALVNMRAPSPQTQTGAAVSVRAESWPSSSSSFSSKPRSASAAAAAVHPDVICLSSGADDSCDSDGNKPATRRRLSMPDGRVGGSSGGSNGPLGKKPVLPSRAFLPSRSSSATAARKRTSHPATKSAASKRSKQTAAAAASSSVPCGTQLSLFGFASPSPRFASPRAASPSLAHTWHNDDDDDDEDAVMCTGSNIFRADPAASAGQPALSEPKGSAPPVAPPHSLASRSSAAHASAASLSAESEASAVQAESAVSEWPSWKLVEVKGPTDRCSMQQIAWLAQLAQCAACHVEVCYVLLPSQVDKWKGASAPTSGAASGAAAARCSSVDLEESD